MPIGFLKNLLGGGKAPDGKPEEQAVLVVMSAQDLPDEVYETYDLMTLEDQLAEILHPNGLGEVDGNEVGPDTATIYIYGRDADAIFSAIEATVRAYPLCERGYVIVRYGPPGAEQRVIQLA